MSYSDPFFGGMKPFLKNVLDIDSLEGNGFFTAMIALFFASYRFERGENVGFDTIVSFISGQCKAGIEKYRSYRYFHQIPKMAPLGEHPFFKQPDHKYILLQRADRYLSAGYSISYNVPVFSYEPKEMYEGGFSHFISFYYNITQPKGSIGLELASGLLRMSASIADSEDGINYEYWIIPLIIGVQRIIPIVSRFELTFKLRTGLYLLIPNVMDEFRFFSSRIGFYLNPSAGLGMALTDRIGVILALDGLLMSSVTTLYFSPTINLMYRF